MVAKTEPRRRQRVLRRAALAMAMVLFAFLPNSSPASAAVTPSGTRQLLVVAASKADPTRATVTAYVWTGSAWKQALPTMASRLGSTGVTDAPTEADGATPTGTYAILYAFGQAPSIASALPYRQTTDQDHWVDDPTSLAYNTWQTGDPDGRWTSAEDLDGYGLAVVFDFNQHPVVANGNSAIFLHAGPPDGTSAGCVTVSSDDLVTLVRWLDPAKDPHITIGVGATPPATPPVA